MVPILLAAAFLHDCDHTVAGPFLRKGSVFQARSETEATERLTVGGVEVRIEESGCTHFGLAVVFRARRGVPSPGQAAAILGRLAFSERGRPPLEMLRDVLRRTKPAMLGRPQARAGGGSVTVTVTGDTLSAFYDFPL